MLIFAIVDRLAPSDGLSLVHLDGQSHTAVVLVDEVKKLPIKISDIYRRLTR